MSGKSEARRAFAALFADSVPNDVHTLIVSSKQPNKQRKPSVQKNQTARKTLRVQCHMSTRDIAAFLRNPQIATFGTMQTKPSDIPQRTMKLIQKHTDGLCRCNERGLICAKQRQRLFTAALNETPPTFVLLFQPGEIDNYIDYANGRPGLGDLKPYFEEIENRVIRCALFLGLMKPIKGLIGSAPDDDEAAERDAIRKIIKTKGRAIGGHIESEGYNKPLKTFDKSLPAG